MPTVLKLALTTAVIAGISWLMIIQGIETKLIVRRGVWSPHASRPVWSQLVTLVARMLAGLGGRNRW